MEFAALIYFIDVICGEHVVWLFMTIFGVIVVCFAKVICVAEKYPEFYKSLWPLKVFLLISIPLLFFIPSKDTAYKMLAAYGVQSIITNPEVQKLGGKSLDVLNKTMDEYLQEGTPKVQPAIPINPEKVEK